VKSSEKDNIYVCQDDRGIKSVCILIFLLQIFW